MNKMFPNKFIIKILKNLLHLVFLYSLLFTFLVCNMYILVYTVGYRNSTNLTLIRENYCQPFFLFGLQDSFVSLLSFWNQLLMISWSLFWEKSFQPSYDPFLSNQINIFQGYFQSEPTCALICTFLSTFQHLLDVILHLIK